MQQAIMAHPFFEGSATLAFGLAGAAMKAIPAVPQAAPVGTDPTDYTELRASLADNITLFSHHKAALLRLVDAKIASTLTRPQRVPQ
jgi:hypothetical protein